MKGTYASAKFDKLHIVSKNENLSDIARAYRIKLNQLIQYNNIANPSLIYAGMKLRIPQKNKPVSSQIKLKKRKSGPSINPVAQKLEAKDIAPKISLESYNLSILRLSKNFYSIRIEVQETLGHIAEWANTTTSRIKKDNKLRSPYIKLNQRVILELSPQELLEFKKKRNEFHLSIQEDFYAAYKIVGDRKYKVKRGDTLGGILKKNSLPLWLVRMYQNVKGGRLTIMSGQNLKLPRVKPRSV